MYYDNDWFFGIGVDNLYFQVKCGLLCFIIIGCYGFGNNSSDRYYFIDFKIFIFGGNCSNGGLNN